MKNTKKYGNYGEAALDAYVRIINQNQEPVVAWDKAIEQLKCCKKGCPKSTFLGLCEDGLIKGVEKGNYTSSKKNKKYALEAVDILRSRQLTITEINPCILWGSLKTNINFTSQTRIKCNQQMEVVLALWDAGYIQQI